VYYFPGQVGQGNVRWEDLPKHALLRDKVLSAWPKDEAGWPKKLQPAEEAVYLAGLSEEERSTVVGLGGSQKAEVAWMDKHNIPYEELDVGEFGLKYLGMAEDMKDVEAVKGVKEADSGFVRSRTLTQDLPPDLGVTTEWSCNPMTAVDQERGRGGNQLEAVL
jgi:hypothetical protein